MSLTETRDFFESVVLKKFPRLKPFYLDNASFKGNCLEIIIPSHGDKNHNLAIYIDINEIVVYFSSWHSHYSLSDSTLELLIEDLDDIFSEKVVVCNYLCRDDPPIKEGVFASTLVNANNRPKNNKEYFYAKEMQYISWLGSYNARFESPYEK